MSTIRRIVSILFVLFCLFHTHAQITPATFSYLESRGSMPKDLIRITEKEEDDFLKELLFEGQILYGTPLNEYLDAIADYLLQNQPKLRKEIRIYINRATEVNAYAHKEGIILVNLGLIAQISNESELAFVIAHEIAHYTEKHSYLLSNYNAKTRSKEFQYILNRYNRSRETEMSADRIALEKYIKDSPYSFKALSTIFDVLQYDYLPFDEITFPRSYLETAFYAFPDEYFLKNLNPIRSRDDHIDTLSTHPNLKKRREYAFRFISGQEEKGRNAFVQSEELFFQTRYLARFECINLFLSNHQYADAIYNTFVLQLNHPDNDFLETAMSAALYGLYKHKQYGNFNDVLENYRKIEGEKQQVHFFFQKVTRRELNLLALRFCWNAYTKHPNNEYLYLLCKDLGQELIFKNQMNLNLFSDYPMGSEPKSIEEDFKNDSLLHIPGNKYQKIKQQNNTRTTKIIPDEKFKTIHFMLIDLKQDSCFIALINSLILEEEDERQLSLVKNKKTALQCDSLFIARPHYERYCRHVSAKNIDKKHRSVGKAKKQITKTIEYSLEKLNIHHIFFSDNSIKSFDTEAYNQHCWTQDWLRDFSQSRANKMILYQGTRADELICKLGYNKLNFIIINTFPASFISFQKVWNLVCYSPVCPVSLPAHLFTFALPKYEMHMSFYILDLKTGNILMNHHEKVTSEMQQGYINNFIYESYYKVKKGI